MNWAMVLTTVEPSPSQKLVLNLRSQLGPNLGHRLSPDPGHRLNPNTGHEP